MHRVLLSLAITMALSACAETEATLEKKAARIHEAAYTVDSHTDTPLKLTRSGFDFMEKNSSKRSKVDLPRMKEGGLDGIWFAVFIGQGERSPEGNLSAMEEAILICDTVDALLKRYPDELELATKASDLKRITRQGKKAIYLGMENGYPIGKNLDLLDTYYKRGIRYVTIVHSYTNDICDSSTDSAEYNGLSPFGEEVVAKMNDLGIMVDLSHASDKTFLDVVAQSRAPVIASHSCAQALCDNPRNLSDDLLVKLK
jgi:membrane dipeptidase